MPFVGKALCDFPAFEPRHLIDGHCGHLKKVLVSAKHLKCHDRASKPAKTSNCCNAASPFFDTPTACFVPRMNAQVVRLRVQTTLGTFGAAARACFHASCDSVRGAAATELWQFLWMLQSAATSRPPKLRRQAVCLAVASSRCASWSLFASKRCF